MILNHKRAIELLVDSAEDIEQAFFVMVHLPYLQPFDDVNKRTSRLAANLSLIKGNLIPLSFVGLSHKAYIDAILGVYELNRIELLRDVFVSAYERSCDQYQVVRRSVGEPNPVRLRYRLELAEMIRDVVLGGDVPRLSTLRTWATTHDIREADQERFAETGLELLLALHEGSSSRYGLRRSELEKWRTGLSPSA